MTRTRESARLLQQVNLFHLELFTSKLVLVKRQLEEEAIGADENGRNDYGPGLGC